MNITLTGMSGAGKSTVGVLLAKVLGFNFLDTDIIIQQREGRLLQQIIDSDGNERFIKTEESAVMTVDVDNTVIATGGSVIYSDRSMQHLASLGKIVYLHVPYEELEGRLCNVSTRGIVFRNGSCLRDVYDERLPLYEKYYDVKIECGKMSVNEIISEIKKQLNM